MKIDGIETTAMEWREGEGLVVRTEDITKAAQAGLAAKLSTVLRGAPFRVLKVCCDGEPSGDHAEDCEASA